MLSNSLSSRGNPPVRAAILTPSGPAPPRLIFSGDRFYFAGVFENEVQLTEAIVVRGGKVVGTEALLKKKSKSKKKKPPSIVLAGSGFYWTPEYATVPVVPSAWVDACVTADSRISTADFLLPVPQQTSAAARLAADIDASYQHVAEALRSMQSQVDLQMTSLSSRFSRLETRMQQTERSLYCLTRALVSTHPGVDSKFEGSPPIVSPTTDCHARRGPGAAALLAAMYDGKSSVDVDRIFVSPSDAPCNSDNTMMDDPYGLSEAWATRRVWRAEPEPEDDSVPSELPSSSLSMTKRRSSDDAAPYEGVTPFATAVVNATGRYSEPSKQILKSATGALSVRSNVSKAWEDALQTVKRQSVPSLSSTNGIPSSTGPLRSGVSCAASLQQQKSYSLAPPSTSDYPSAGDHDGGLGSATSARDSRRDSSSVDQESLHHRNSNPHLHLFRVTSEHSPSDSNKEQNNAPMPLLLEPESSLLVTHNLVLSTDTSTNGNKLPLTFSPPSLPPPQRSHSPSPRSALPSPSSAQPKSSSISDFELQPEVSSMSAASITTVLPTAAASDGRVAPSASRSRGRRKPPPSREGSLPPYVSKLLYR